MLTTDVGDESITGIISQNSIGLDKADVINISWRSFDDHATSILSSAIDNIALTNPYMVFVAAAGDKSPGLFSNLTPAVAMRGIAVGGKC